MGKGYDVKWINMVVVFFCKQKTAYEMLRRLLGSEMCIRDSQGSRPIQGRAWFRAAQRSYATLHHMDHTREIFSCLLYTSDAADDLHCVDLGGRRIIKKKTSKLLTFS